MKRRPVRISVFLLLGAIVNVAVAWGLVLSGGIGKHRTSPDRIFPEAIESQEALWTKFAPSDFHAAPDGGTQLDPLGFTFLNFWAVSGDEYSERREEATIYLAGLPAPSLIGYQFECFYKGPSQWTLRANTLARIRRGDPSSDPDDLWLPFRPLWPGFAINTVFYAAVLWLLFAGPFVVRRWRRVRKGLCPKCGYDLRGRPSGADSATCPECGAGATCAR